MGKNNKIHFQFVEFYSTCFKKNNMHIAMMPCARDAETAIGLPASKEMSSHLIKRQTQELVSLSIS